MLLFRGGNKELKNYNSQTPFQVTLLPRDERRARAGRDRGFLRVPVGVPHEVRSCRGGPWSAFGALLTGFPLPEKRRQ